MSLITDFKNILAKYGLEYYKRYYSFYRAKVYDNKDPEYKGRLRVIVPQIYGKTSPNDWANPVGAVAGKKSGIFWVPSIGDPIYVAFENGDPSFPLWLYGWWLDGQQPEDGKRENPNNYILQTPAGSRIELDDEKGYIRMENKEGQVIEVNADGFFVGNKKENLGQLIQDLFTLFENTTVATQLGAQKFINLIEYGKLKEKYKGLILSSGKK